MNNRHQGHDEAACPFCSSFHERTDLDGEQVRAANAAHDDVLFFDAERVKVRRRLGEVDERCAKALAVLTDLLSGRRAPEPPHVDMWRDIASAGVSDAPSRMRPSNGQPERGNS